MVSTNLANSLKDLGRLEEAEELHRDAIERFGKTFGKDDRQYMRLMGNLGTVVTAQGRHAEAEQLYGLFCNNFFYFDPFLPLSLSYSARTVIYHLFWAMVSTTSC